MVLFCTGSFERRKMYLACFLMQDAERGNSILLSREKRKLSERKKVFQEPVAMGPNTHTESLDRSQPGGWPRRPSEGRRDRWGMWKGLFFGFCFVSMLEV